VTMATWFTKMFGGKKRTEVATVPAGLDERVRKGGDPDDPSTPRPLLTLSEFFDGNTVVGSICCNLDPTPQPDEVRRVLAAIAARTEVAEVRVQVTAFDDPAWPFSDTVWVITSASADTVGAWFPEPLRPDEVAVGWQDGVSYETVAVPNGMKAVACFWD